MIETRYLTRADLEWVRANLGLAGSDLVQVESGGAAGRPELAAMEFIGAGARKETCPSVPFHGHIACSEKGAITDQTLWYAAAIPTPSCDPLAQSRAAPAPPASRASPRRTRR